MLCGQIFYLHYHTCKISAIKQTEEKKDRLKYQHITNFSAKTHNLMFTMSFTKPNNSYLFCLFLRIGESERVKKKKYIATDNFRLAGPRQVHVTVVAKATTLPDQTDSRHKIGHAAITSTCLNIHDSPRPAAPHHTRVGSGGGGRKSGCGGSSHCAGVVVVVVSVVVVEMAVETVVSIVVCW